MSINRDNFEEQLFNASEKHAYAFQENDWDVLEGLLEKKKKRRAFIFWLNGIGLFLIASCFAAYFMVQSYQQSEADELCEAEEKEALQMSAVANSSDSIIEYLNKNTNTHEAIALTESNIQYQSDMNTDKDLYTVSANTKMNNKVKSVNREVNDDDIGSGDASPTLLTKSAMLEVQVATEDVLTKENELLQKKKEEMERQIAEANKEDVKSASADSLALNADSSLTAASADSSSKPKEVAKDDKDNSAKDSAKFSRVSVLFSLTPDLSFTQLVDISKLQLTAFVGGEFNITQNFSALLGVAYSNKSYLARGSDYTPGKPKFWTGGVKPREVSGSCSIIDMSLALRYYHTFNNSESTKFFAEIGSSSYLMMKEHYDFIYANPNPALIQQWNVQSGIVYSFSVMNFSLGVERKIKEHWSIQASPKFQMPLSALGWGSVKFSSTGLNMTIKYSF